MIKRVVVLGLIFPVLSAISLAQTRDPLNGVWERTQQPNAMDPLGQDFRVIFMNGQYIQFGADQTRAKEPRRAAEMTKEQLVERLRLAGQYGTYRVEGDTVIREILNAANPNNSGTSRTEEFRIENDTLILVRTNQEGQRNEQRFKRVN